MKNNCNGIIRQVSLSDFQSESRGLNPTPLHHIKFELVNNKNKRRAFSEFTEEWHKYKKQSKYVGRQMNWLVYMGSNLIGTIGLGSPILLLPVRDEYIGWGKDTTYRKDNPKWRNLNKVANNWRFTLKDKLPKNTASKVLSILLHKAKNDWLKKYGERLYLLESLVQQPFTGNCYLASGWKLIGETSGYISKQVDGSTIPFGKNKRNAIGSKLLKFDGEKKLIFVKPLHKFWKEVLLK